MGIVDLMQFDRPDETGFSVADHVSYLAGIAAADAWAAVETSTTRLRSSTR
jgi:hypothetical protein